MKRLSRILVLFTILLAGHILGSYDMELFDALDNYGMNVPFVERLVAPLRDAPFLIRQSWTSPSTDLIPYWAAYFLPLTCVIGACIIFSLRKKHHPTRSFDL